MSSGFAVKVIRDYLKTHPEVASADGMYLHFRGESLGTGGYSPQRLFAAAENIRGHASAGLNIYVFFNNGQGGQV